MRRHRFFCSLPLTAQVGKNFEIKGEIIRSLKTFQDLSVTARIELPGDSNQAGLVTATLRQTILAGAQLQNTPSALVQDDTDAMKKKALDFLSKHQADLDAQIKNVDAEKRKLEWPPPIPVYSSAGDWAKQYQEAKPITTSEFLARTPSVRLAIFANPGIQKYFSDEEWLGLVRRTVETNGFKVRPDAPVKLVVETTIEESRLDYSEENSNGIGSTVVNSFPVGLQFLKLKFVVTAPVLRFGRFHNLEVAPVSQWTCKLLRGNVDKDYLDNNCQDQIKDLIAGFRKPAEPDKNDDGAEKAWLASLWDRKRDSQMYEDYLTASKATGVELERCFCDFPRVKNYGFFPDEAARQALNIDSYTAQWVQCLNENQAAESSADYIVFKQDLRSYRQGASVAAETLFGFEGSPYYSNISAARFYQYNVVFPMDNPEEAGAGRPALVRGRALIFDEVEGDMCVPRNSGYDLRELNKRTMEEVVKQIRYRH
jgi:hypothetical protein